MKLDVPQWSALGALLFLFHVNDIKCAIGCDDIKVLADDTFLLASDTNIFVAKEQAIHNFDEAYRWWFAKKFVH